MAMAQQDPSKQQQPQQDEQQRPGDAHSGRGVESAMRRLREWEQRRAKGESGPPRDRPAAD
jgi:hypothetical protein